MAHGVHLSSLAMNVSVRERNGCRVQSAERRAQSMRRHHLEGRASLVTSMECKSAGSK